MQPQAIVPQNSRFKPRKSRKNVGLIGLGIIGSRVAAGLRSGGYHVFVWNRHPRPAPNFLGSAIEVAELCEVIQLFVADGPAVLQTIEAMADALTERHVIINCATIGPEATLEAARLVQAHGAAFLDAPFTGSKGAAEKSQLVYYVGGESVVFDRVKPVLEATSRAIVHCGKIGDAATLKIATNLITAVTTQTLAEALAIVKKCGIAPEAFGAALQQNACKSGVIELKLPKMLTGDYSPHFSLKHMFKDVQLGIQMANSMKLEIPLTAATAGVMFGGMNKGWADMDFASVFKNYDEVLPAKPEVISLTTSPVSPAPEAEKGKHDGLEIVEAQIVEEHTSSQAYVESDAGAGKSPDPAISKDAPADRDRSGADSLPAQADESFFRSKNEAIEVEVIGETNHPEKPAVSTVRSDDPAPTEERDLNGEAARDEKPTLGAMQRLRRLFSSSDK